MTPQQIADAQKLAREWQAAFEKKYHGRVLSTTRRAGANDRRDQRKGNGG